MYDGLVDNQLTSVICHLGYLTDSLFEVISAAALSRLIMTAKYIITAKMLSKCVLRFFVKQKPARCRLFSTA